MGGHKKIGGKFVTITGAIIGAITVVAVAIFSFYKFREPSLPDKFKEYKYLSSKPIETINYEVVKIIDSWKGEAQADGIHSLKSVLYDKESNNIFLITEFRKRKTENWIWKIDHSGKVIDSIEIGRELLLNSGVHFGESYFIDWVISGNKEKKKYNDILDGDSLSNQELTRLIDEALQKDVGADYKNQTANIFLKSKIGWSLIKSKKTI